jgi:hypothetical protein
MAEVLKRVGEFVAGAAGFGVAIGLLWALLRSVWVAWRHLRDEIRADRCRELIPLVVYKDRILIEAVHPYAHKTVRRLQEIAGSGDLETLRARLRHRMSPENLALCQLASESMFERPGDADHDDGQGCRREGPKDS